VGRIQMILEKTVHQEEVWIRENECDVTGSTKTARRKSRVKCNRKTPCCPGLYNLWLKRRFSPNS
jgi:hypothetical protein